MQNDMRDRLVEIINKDNCPSPYMCSNKCKYSHLEQCIGDRLADRILADGWLRLPCKVGQTVWFIRKSGLRNELIETTVEKIISKKGGIFLKLACNSMYETTCNSIGRTVFLTKEQAEQKLKELSENG